MKKNIIYNKKAKFNYLIKKKIIAGISLKGYEIKSIRKKNINLEKGFILINKNKIPYAKGIKIKKIKKNLKLKEERKIKILLKKKEINYLINKIKHKKYTIIILSLIIKNPWFKIKIALAQGKKKFDKKKKIMQKIWNKERKKINIY